MAAIGGTIGLEKSTTENYIKLLEAVFLIYRLPAWDTTLGSRITRHPKVHLVDSGVVAWLLNLTAQKIDQASPAALSEYGHLLETFAVGEILKQVSWRRLKCQLAGLIVAGRRPTLPSACLRWLPIWLPRDLVSLANGWSQRRVPPRQRN